MRSAHYSELSYYNLLCIALLFINYHPYFILTTSYQLQTRIWSLSSDTETFSHFVSFISLISLFRVLLIKPPPLLFSRLGNPVQMVRLFANRIIIGNIPLNKRLLFLTTIANPKYLFNYLFSVQRYEPLAGLISELMQEVRLFCI